MRASESPQEIRSAVNSGVKWNELAWFTAVEQNPNVEVIKFLIDSGADVHTRDRNKRGSVSHAKGSKRSAIPRRDEVIKMLLAE